MPTNTQFRNPDNGQFISQKEYFEMLLDGLEKSVEARFTAMEKAVTVANIAFEKRMDTTNEWRNTVEDISKNNVSLLAFDAFKESVKKDLDFLRLAVQSIQISDATLAGKASQTQVYVVWVFSAVNILMGLWNLFNK